MSLTDRELHCLTDLCRRAVEAKPDYRHGQQVLAALRELKQRREIGEKMRDFLAEQKGNDDARALWEEWDRVN